MVDLVCLQGRDSWLAPEGLKTHSFPAACEAASRDDWLKCASCTCRLTFPIKERVLPGIRKEDEEEDK